MRLDELNARILEGLSGEEKEDFLAGLKVLDMDNPADRAKLRESIKRLRPEYTEAQLDIFCEGRVKDMGHTRPAIGGDKEALIASLKRAHPDWNDAQIETFIAGR